MRPCSKQLNDLPQLEACQRRNLCSLHYANLCRLFAHLGDGERRAPLVLQDVQADLAVAVDIAVVDARAVHHLHGDAAQLWDGRLCTSLCDVYQPKSLTFTRSLLLDPMLRTFGGLKG